MKKSCDNRAYRICLLFLFFVLPAGCKQKSGNFNFSNLNYLQNKSYDCVLPTEDRRNFIESSIPKGFIRGYSQEETSTIIDRMAVLPNKDLGHLAASFDNRVFKGISPQNYWQNGVLGLTTLQPGETWSGTKGYVATKITTAPESGGSAVQHEIGHAVEILGRERAAQQKMDFSQSLKMMLSEFNSKDSLLREYAKSDESEAWAESYANYYCSKESHDFIKNNLPETYAFLGKVLFQPFWEQRNNNDTAAASEFQNARSLLKGTGARLTDSIMVAVMESEDNPDRINISFSTEGEIRKIKICTQDSEICAKKKSLDDNNYLSAIQRNDDRNFYSVLDVGKTTLQNGWTLLGYSQDGRLLDLRRIRIIEW
ncbi:MAG: hypothetical protein HQK54_03840 [Oligoflexales bacterium]|nr:hypothetical protein [Oligoflexales bacterium]